VDSNTGPERAYFADYRTLEEARSRFCRSGRGATPSLIRVLPLIALSVLSLGFWAVILVAVASSALVRLW
jgi:hypothetical protein